MHILQVAGSQRGRSADPLLQPQVRVRGALQHRHSPPHKHSQDNAGESHQGQLDSTILIISTLTAFTHSFFPAKKITRN